MLSMLRNASRLFMDVDNSRDVQHVKYDNVWKVATSGNGPAVAQMEQELNQVRSLMEGLSTQGSKLSETMQSMKPPVSDAVPSSAGGWKFDDADFGRH